MKEKSYFVLSFLILSLLMILYYFFIFSHSESVIKSGIEKQFISDMRMKAMLFDNSILTSIQGTKSISSRSMIKSKIKQYKDNMITFTALKDYTFSKYIDGIKALENVISATRYVDDEILVHYGDAPNEDFSVDFNQSSGDDVFVFFPEENPEEITYIYSPIIYQNEFLGYDLLSFDNSAIIEVINDSNLVFRMISSSGKIETEKFIYNDKYGEVVFKSKNSASYFKFSTPQNVLFRSMKSFYISQFSIALLLFLSILMFIITLYKRFSRYDISLREKEHRLRIMFENNGVPTIIISPDTQKIEDANEAACRFYGYSLEKIKELCINDFDTVTEEIGSTLISDKHYDNFRHQLADGTIKDVEAYSSKINFEGNEKQYLIIHDITEKKKAEKQIKDLVNELSEANKKLNLANEELNVNYEELYAMNDELNANNEELYAMNDKLHSLNLIIESDREKFLSILDSIPEIIYVSDFETNEILFSNKKLNEIVGRDITGEICYKVIQNNNKICDFCTNPYIKNTDKIYRWDYHNPFLNKDFYIVDRKIQWTDQKEARFEIAIDVSRQKEAENELRKNEEKYRLIAENASDVIWILNLAERKFTYISPSVYSLRGFTPEEAMNQTIEQALTPESAKIVNKGISENVPKFCENPDEISKNIYINELQQYHKDGSVIWIETSSRYRYNNNNEIEVVGISRNIEERKKHQEYLATHLRYEENLAKFSNTLFLDESDVIEKSLFYILKAAQCSRVYIFENFEDENKELSSKQIYGVSEESIESQMDNSHFKHLRYKNDGFDRWKIKLYKNEIINGNISEFPAEEEKFLHIYGIESLLVIPIWVHQKWYGFIGFDAVHEKTWTEDDINLLRTVSEILGLYFENLFNKQIVITQNDQLIKANATKDKFFSIIAHDLKNPFNSIIGFSNILLRDINTLKNDEIVRFIEAVNKGAKQAFKLLENLLEWARTQTGHIEFKPISINVNDIIKDVINESQSFADSKSIMIENKAESDISIKADNNMLDTILRNLVNNSIKFTESKGKISLNAYKTQEGVLFEVIDTGIGMSEELSSKLFKIEEKITNPGTNNEAGTGLGLLICKEFVDLHNGKIWVESKKGEGSAFKFLIPF